MKQKHESISHHRFPFKGLIMTYAIVTLSLTQIPAAKADWFRKADEPKKGMKSESSEMYRNHSKTSSARESVDSVGGEANPGVTLPRKSVQVPVTPRVAGPEVSKGSAAGVKFAETTTVIRPNPPEPADVTPRVMPPTPQELQPKVIVPAARVNPRVAEVENMVHKVQVNPEK